MRRFLPDAASATPAPDDRCVLVAGRRLLISRVGDLDAAWIPLGALDGARVWAAGLAEPRPDGEELAEARWFPLDALPANLPPTYSISRWLIDAVH